MKVYRIEDPSSGLGPYNSTLNDETLSDDLQDAHGDENHLALWVDCELKAPTVFTMMFGPHPEDAYKSACPSLKTLKKWFDGFLPRILKAGYRVYSMDVHRGDFKRSRSGMQIAIREEGIMNKKIVRGQKFF